MMSNTQKRVSAAFLAYCSEDRAYEWLADNPALTNARKLNRSLKYELHEERKLLEYLLLRRRDRLIDLGLAQFACSESVLKRVFSRGCTATRCAVLSNPFLFGSSIFADDAIVPISEIVKRNNYKELEALALNQYLPDDFYIKLIERKSYFSQVDDIVYKRMLVWLGENERLSRPYDDTWMEGYDDFRYHQVFSAAWQLSANSPTTQEWASILDELLSRTQEPRGFDNLEDVIERWRIDLPKNADDRNYYTEPSFYLRSRLADLLEADEKLIKSQDLALRLSFYRRFSPYRFKGWERFVEIDGEKFVQEVISSNLQVWKIPAERETLSELAWDCPDPTHDMMMPNLFRSRKKALRDDHPEWFEDDSDGQNTRSNAIFEQIETSLRGIEERLDEIDGRFGSSGKGWWR